MSEATAINMLKAEMSNHKDFDMIGFKREYLEKIISELEDEVTDADIAVLGVSSVVFGLVERIDDLETWRKKHEDPHQPKVHKTLFRFDEEFPETLDDLELSDSNGGRTSTTR